jgi:uncharacterized protein (UPF0332 family)
MTAAGGAAQSSHDATLLRVSKATKVELGFFREGVHIEAATQRSLVDLQSQVCVDRLKLAESILRSGSRFMRLRPADYRSAIGRFYYSMYHTTRSVVYFSYGGDDHESHAALPTKLPKDFPNAAIWTNDLKSARSRRNEADYDPYPMLDADLKSHAVDLSTKAPALIALARQYLRRKGCAYL